MTIGEMIAQLRSIQETHGDLPAYVGEVEATGIDIAPTQKRFIQVLGEVEVVPKRVVLSGASIETLSVVVSDSVAVGDQLG